jgi:hypothetical protein
MRRPLSAALVVVSMFAAVSCGEGNIAGLATGPGRANNGPTKATTTFNACTSIADLQVLLASAMGAGSPNLSSESGKLDNIQQQLDNGNDAEVRSHAYTAAEFLIQHEPYPQGSQSDLVKVLNGLFCYMGSSATASTSSTIFVVSPSDPTENLTTPNGQAGLHLDGSAFSEPTIVTITPIDFTPPTPGAGPLNTKLDQYAGYYEFGASNGGDTPLQHPVVVAVCPPANIPADVRARLRLGHQASAGFEITPPADATFLSCQEQVPSRSIGVSGGRASLSVGGRRGDDFLLLATGGVGGTAGEFSPFDPVDPLLSATGGVGGTAGEFTRISTGSRQNLIFTGGRGILAPTCPTSWPVGSSVSADCRPTVIIKTNLGTALQNVPVSFAVTAGGGSTAGSTAGTCGTFGSTALTATDASGNAIACWNIGDPGTNTLVGTPGVGGDVPTGATFSPANLTFTTTATGEDVTPPVITGPTITGTLGNNGWYVTDVTLIWSVSDPGSGIVSSSGCNVSVTTDTNGTTLSCSATNGVGLSSTSESVTIKRDATKPIVAFSGNQGSYTIDQTISITCSATDAMSGIASSSCPSASGDAYTFPLGTNSLSASATDNAGNASSASTSYTVSVTYQSLCALTKRWVSNAGVASSLCAKLTAAEQSDARGNAQSKAGQMGAYSNEIRAQTGKSLTSARAALLLSFAAAL